MAGRRVRGGAHDDGSRHAVDARSIAAFRLWRGEARRGRAGQAVPAFAGPGMTGSTTTNSLARASAGHDRMTRPSRRSPLGELLADAGSEPGNNTSPLGKEPDA